MRVKICGITNFEDAGAAVDLGAWALGLIHFRASPRYCEPEVAARVGAGFRRSCEVVGVFVNPSLGEVAKAVENAGLTMVQLSGEEGPAFCAEVARRTGARVVKAIHVSSGADLQAAEVYATDYHLFDARHGTLRGGTGRSFDWSLVSGRRTETPAIIAGGLGPRNVGEAIEVTRPYAVDVASGVESEPGRKDPELLSAFFEAANAASAARA